ncbi:MAG: FAD:protein FMN transferase [Chloroflexota bacterium]
MYQDAHGRGKLPSATAVIAALPLVNYHHLQLSCSQISFNQPGMSVTVEGIGKGDVMDGRTAVLREHGSTNTLVKADGGLLAAGKNRGTLISEIRISSLAFRNWRN